MFVISLVLWVGELEAVVTNWWRQLPSILPGLSGVHMAGLRTGEKVRKRM